ncbi:MAG: sugar ABC transporter substrate-binding protein [Clostridia bacterium]|nr:sugar ABC transporter substrate-binding protein [Clostridia bacterium]
MKTRKIVALLLSVLMMMSFATIASAERVQLTFSIWGDAAEAETTQRALDVFNASQDRIHVTVMQIGRDEYTEKLQTMATAGNMPDAGMAVESDVIGWARDGLLSNVDIFEGQENLPLEYITFKDKGQTVAYSAANEVLGLWYNREMFDAAGVPYPPATLDAAWSWDEFIEVAKLLTFDANGLTPNDEGFDKDNIVQYGAYVNQYTWQLEVWALSNGGRWFSEDGTEVVFDDAAIEGMQKVVDLHLVHHVAPFIDGTQDAGFASSLGAGNVAMCTEGQWATGFRAFMDVDYGVAVLPYMEVKANICTGGPTAMFKTTQYPEETAEFLRWYNSEENNIGTILDGWWMPTKLNWYTDEELLQKWVEGSELRVALPAEAYRTAMVDVALDFDVTKSTAWYYTPHTTEMLVGVLQPAMVEAINGDKTVKEVVESVRAAMEAVLSR